MEESENEERMWLVKTQKGYFETMVGPTTVESDEVKQYIKGNNTISKEFKKGDKVIVWFNGQQVVAAFYTILDISNSYCTWNASITEFTGRYHKLKLEEAEITFDFRRTVPSGAVEAFSISEDGTEVKLTGPELATAKSVGMRVKVVYKKYSHMITGTNLRFFKNPFHLAGYSSQAYRFYKTIVKPDHLAQIRKSMEKSVSYSDYIARRERTGESEGESAEGESAEGESAEEESAEAESAEAESAEAESAEAKSAEAESAEGELAVGGLAEGEAVEGEVVEGGSTEGRSAEVGSAEGSVKGRSGESYGDMEVQSAQTITTTSSSQIETNETVNDISPQTTPDEVDPLHADSNPLSLTTGSTLDNRNTDNASTDDLLQPIPPAEPIGLTTPSSPISIPLQIEYPPLSSSVSPEFMFQAPSPPQSPTFSPPSPEVIEISPPVPHKTPSPPFKKRKYPSPVKAPPSPPPALPPHQPNIKETPKKKSKTETPKQKINQAPPSGKKRKNETPKAKQNEQEIRLRAGEYAYVRGEQQAVWLAQIREDIIVDKTVKNWWNTKVPIQWLLESKEYEGRYFKVDGVNEWEHEVTYACLSNTGLKVKKDKGGLWTVA